MKEAGRAQAQGDGKDDENMTYDDFEQIAREEVALLPPYVFDELTGGVLVDPKAYLHPRRVADDLYILGTYSTGYTGKQIVLYYGSFMATMGNRSREEIRAQIRDTVRHEFRHHLETRAGLFWKDTLIEEDRNRMLRYYMQHRSVQEEKGE
ncbi:MAG: metallopeptidase family protein [Lachnospiraceae bacterium]|nr:metallopeptidase family protein [Lachnospiraceae bacterium]